MKLQFSSVAQSSDYLRSHGLQYSGPPCPSPTPRGYSNSCPLTWWCYPTTSSSVPPASPPPSVFPSIMFFSNESALCIRWPKYWSFSFSPSNEYSWLISSRINWFDLLAVQGTLKNFIQHYSLKASVLWCSAFFMVQLTSIHDNWKNHCFDYIDSCWQILCLGFNTLSRFVIAFLSRSKHLLISWL